MEQSEKAPSGSPRLTERQTDELGDLTRLAVDRVRDAAMSVGQLIESEALRGSMLSAVALDVLYGAASLIAEASGRSERHAVRIVIAALIDKIKEEEEKEDRDAAASRSGGGDVEANARAAQESDHEARRGD